MKFEKGKLYTHQNMLDTCVYVYNSITENPHRIYIGWFLKSGLNMNIEELITIKPEQLEYWHEYTRK